MIQDGEDSVEGVWQQGDADPDAGAGRGGQDDHPLQAEARAVRQHYPHRRLQRGNSHLQEREVQCVGE